jgi:hypothetical protein
VRVYGSKSKYAIMHFSNYIAFGSSFIKYSCYIYVCLSARKKSITTELKFVKCGTGEFLVKVGQA